MDVRQGFKAELPFDKEMAAGEHPASGEAGENCKIFRIIYNKNR